MMKVVDDWRAKYLKFLMQYKVDFPELSNIDAEIFRWERKWTFYEGDLPIDIYHQRLSIPTSSPFRPFVNRCVFLQLSPLLHVSASERSQP